MKIAFPTQKPQGLDSPVYGHFGTADFFILVSTDDNSVATIANQDKDHAHGHCQPARALGNEKVDGVVLGGIGGGALVKLQAMGVTVYRAVEGTVQENLQLMTAGRLPVFCLDQTCAGHGNGPDGGCHHHH